MREHSENFIQKKWFTLGVAISLSAATFASPIGTSMDQAWHRDASGKVIPINYAYGIDSNRSAHVDPQWVARQPWSGPWWATRSGSIAVRWRTALYWNADHTEKLFPEYGESDSLTYHPYSADELDQMSDDSITELSPVEKLDIVNGHADPAKNGYYSNLHEVRGWVKTIAREYSRELSYHGLCHGASHAAMWLPEPGPVNVPVTYTLSNGKRRRFNVNFGTGDLKALATYYYGQRTFDDTAGHYAGFIGENERGMNPAALHLLLTNLVWDSKMSFVVDINRGKEIWNYPVVGFEMNTYASGRASAEAARYGAAKEVYVETTIHYMGTSDPSQHPLKPETARKHFETHSYQYRLELDSADRIVGGSWAGASEQPDYAWIIKGKIPFVGDYAFLENYWVPELAPMRTPSSN